MKVGTISLNINAPDFNYGAVLHSWAFQQFLKKVDCVEYTEIIDYTMPILEGQDLAHPFFTAFKRLQLRTALRHLLTMKQYQKRYKKFKKFRDFNMIVSKEKYTQRSLNDAELDYDCIICESDVIWAPDFFDGNFDKSFFLASDSMKKMRRIAYAPSMSNGNLNYEQEKRLEELLKFPDDISCRESYEKMILEKHTDKPVTHVLDPVMLLCAEEYESICGERITAESYILLYLPVDDNDKLRLCAAQYAETHGLRIVEISTKLKSYKEGNLQCIGDAGIEEFLSAIKYADVVFTNSFHAICFSIIYNREFYAFSRANFGKVQDVCKTFGVADRYFSDDRFLERSAIDFEEVNRTWNQLKEKSWKWLEKALWGG